MMPGAVRVIRGFGAVTLLLAAASCSKEPASPGAQPASTSPARASVRPNLVLITMDTTRADHLGCYGDARAETPNLDALAREGATCDQAIAVAPLTLPSHVSVLTGLYPPRSGVRDNTDFRLPDDETTLAEHLKAQGYACSASVGTFILAGELGLSQGFDRYDEPKRSPRVATGDAASVRLEQIVDRPATDVVNDAIESIDRMKDRPFFLWVHVYDPHEPYAPPPSFRARFAGRLYDGEIASMDAELGRLFDHLRALGLIDRTVIAATADHGESLGEHGEATHGLLIYDSTIRVPLIVRDPAKIHGGTRYAGLNSGVDLAPTLLDLMGLPPMPDAQGRSFAAGLTGGNVAEREPVYAESLYGERAYGWAPLHGLRSSGVKYIDAPERELYDLARDPGELMNIASQLAAAATTWSERLGVAEQAMGPADPTAAASMTDEQRARVASLGYASAGAPRAGRKDRPDPKSLVAVNDLFLEAQQEVGAGHSDLAAGLLERALAKDPGNPAVSSLLGAIRYSKDDRSTGLAQLRAAAAASPSSFEIQWNLGNALFLERRFDEAAKAFRAAIGLRPNSSETHYALGNVLTADGDDRGAITQYDDAIKLGLRTPPVLAALGAARFRTGDAAGAEASLRAAVEADPKLADGWNQLGILLDKTGRRAEGLAAFSHALETQPDHADALFNRAKLELLGKDLPAARRDLDRLLAAHPSYAAGGFLDAHLCVAEGNTAGAKAALTRFLAMKGTDPRMREAAQGMLGTLGGG
jgi:arylsulfatase A-like enzyme/Flp pilus assembly protein TadD